MAQGRGRRVLPLVYFGAVTAVTALLILVGFALDGLPFLPSSATRGYKRVMFAAISGLARPIDGLMDQPADPVAGGVVGESTP